MGEVIVITSGKGGVGKTTTMAKLASKCISGSTIEQKNLERYVAYQRMRFQ